MLTQSEEAKIILWNNRIPSGIELGLIVTDDARSGDLREFCDRLKELAPQVSVLEEFGAGGNVPAIRVAPSIRYLAIPAGRELEPFLQAMVQRHEDESVLPFATREKMAGLDVPAQLRLYVSKDCPNCPAAVREIIPLALASPLVTLEIVDAFLFEELAREDDVQGVPTLLLNSVMRWMGVTSADEVADVMVRRDPATFSSETFERILYDGGAIGVARMMLNQGELFPAFIELLTDEKFRTRLGAMTALEEVTKQDMDLAFTAIDPLWDRFGDVIEPVQIDILFFLGDVGNDDTIAKLEAVIDGDYRSHVKDAAREAIERIRERAE